MSKKILVTGGAGYVGSALIPELIKCGYEVRVFDKLLYGDFGLADVRDKIELVEGDVVNPPANLLDGIWGVIHLAGFSTEPTAYFNPRQTDKVNHLGTENIARMAKSKGIERFVFASTCSVYFTYDTPLVPPLYKEEDQVNAISPYSITKISAEEALKEITDDNFKPIIFRKGTIYGFSPKMRYDLVLNSFTKDAFKNKKITVHAGGEIYRPMLDIQDAVIAYIRALELPLESVGGKTFNILNSNWRIGDLAKKFSDILNQEKNINVEVEIQPIGVTRNYRADDSKFRQVFNFSANRSLREAILELWRQLENGCDLNDPRFYTDIWLKDKLSKNNGAL
jgi:nucleoside-diphosphate-sugar epimerase